MKRCFWILALVFFLAFPCCSWATVSSTTTRISYSGNGTTTIFPYTFYILAESDLQVIVRSASGVDTIQVLNVDYTVSGEGTPSGGNVTMATAPVTGETLVILRAVPITQGTDYIEGHPFSANTHEQALDRLTMIAQQQDEKIGRAIKFPTGSTLFDVDMPTPVASRVLGFNSGANGLILYPTTPAYTATTFDHVGNYSDSLTTAIAEIGSDEVTLIVNKAITLTASETIPATLKLMFIDWGKITLGTYNLTIPCGSVMAPPGQFVFNENSSGRVTITGNCVRYCEWWGGAGDNSTDNHTPIERALSSGTGTLILYGTTYLTTDSITMPSNNTLHIMEGTTLKIDDAATGSIKIIDASNASTANVSILGPGTIDGNESGATGLTKANGIELRGSNIYVGNGLKIQNIKDDSGSWGDGVLVEYCTSTTSNSLTFDNLYFDSCGRNSISVVNGEDINISNILSYNAGHDHIDLELAITVGGYKNNIRRVNISNVIGEDAVAQGISVGNAETDGGVIDGVNIQNIHLLDTGIHGINIQGNSTTDNEHINIDNIHITEAGDAASEHGVFVKYCNHVNLVNALIQKSASDGIRTDYVEYLKIRNLNTYNNGVAESAMGLRCYQCTNIDLDGITAYDGASGTQAWGLYLDTVTTAIIGGNLNLAGNTTNPFFYTGITNWATSRETVKIGTIAAGTDDERPVFIAPGPGGCVIVNCLLANAADIDADGTDYETFALKDKGADGTGTDVISDINTNSAGDNCDLDAFEHESMAVTHIMDALYRTLTAGDVLSFSKTHAGSGKGTDEMVLSIMYVPW